MASKATSDHPGPQHLRALQAGDVASDGFVPWDFLRYVEPVRSDERYGIREGDLLLPLRSARIIAFVAREIPPGIIAVGHWAIISPDIDVAEPDFLAWYLNHPTTAARLAGLTRGTKLQFLSLRDLRDFEIELPPLKAQRRIARVHALHRRVDTLEQQLATVRKQYIDAATLAALRSPSVFHSNPA